MTRTVYDPAKEENRKLQNTVKTDMTPATASKLPGNAQAATATMMANVTDSAKNMNAAAKNGAPAPAETTLAAPSNGAPSYTPATLPTYRAQTEKVNELYDAQEELRLAQLESAYDNSTAKLKAEKEKIPQVYDAQANAVSAGSEISKQNFNEYAAGSGLNTGAGSQVELARMNQLQANISALRTEQANAEAEVERQLSELYVTYQNEIRAAIAENDYNRAAALYAEYQKQEQSVVDTAAAQESLRYQQYLSQYNEYVRTEENAREDQRYADENAREDANTAKQEQTQTDKQTRADAEAKAENLAAYGDFSGYLALGYTQDEVDYMQGVWAAANPELAAALGIGGTASAPATPAAPAPGSGWDNGELTTAQVIALQNALGVTADGKYGKNSMSAAGGLTADEAYKKFVSDVDKPKTTGGRLLNNVSEGGQIFIPGYGGPAGAWLAPSVVEAELKAGNIEVDTTGGNERYYAKGALR